MQEQPRLSGSGQKHVHPKTVAYYQGRRWGLRMAPVMKAYAEAEKMLFAAIDGEIAAESSVYRLLGQISDFKSIPSRFDAIRQGDMPLAILTIEFLVEVAWMEDPSLRYPVWKFSA